MSEPNSTNPLRLDPTRTTMLRNAFMSDMGKRFRALRGAIWQFVYEEDAFGLRADAKMARGANSNMPQSPALRIFAAQGIYNAAKGAIGPQAGAGGTIPRAVTLTANAERFRFNTDAEKVEGYRAWLKQQVDDKLLGVGTGGNVGAPWTEEYISSAYKKGLVRAYTDSHVGEAATETLPFVEGGQKAFLDMSFNAPVGQNKLKLLSTRAFTELKGVTAAMDQEMSRTLAEGLANGYGAEKIARNLNKNVEGLERKRARVIARTEVIRAHAEGQLDAFEAMNIEDVGVMAEWSTAHDGLVCPLCAPLEGVVMTVKEARGLIPRHPNCRCAWIPANVGEHIGGTTTTTWAGPEQGLELPGTAPTGKTTGQVWHKDEVAARLRDSIKAEFPKLAAKEARAASRWVGADITSVSQKIKPGSKAAAEVKAAAKAVKVAEAVVKKKEARVAAAQAKAEHSMKVKVGMVKKKYGLTDEDMAVVYGSGNQPSIAYGAGVKWAKTKGVELTEADWKLANTAAEGYSGPGIPHIQAKMKALEDVVNGKLAAQAESKAMAEGVAKKVAAWTGPGPEATVLDHADLTGVPGWAAGESKKKQSYGVLLFDDQGRILMREPTDHYGGAHWTFAKGGGANAPGSTAFKELGEETGHTASLHDMLPGKYKGKDTQTNYFIGKSTGYSPGLMDTETHATKWMTYDEAIAAINQSTEPAVVARDMEVLKNAFAHVQQSDGGMFKQIVKDGEGKVEEAKKKAAAAAHGHKVKLGMVQKNYTKEKFGGGVTDADWANPGTKQLLNMDGINKVLSEKGWHMTTLPEAVVEQLAHADDVVAQKAIMDGLKKAPKSTPPPPAAFAPPPANTWKVLRADFPGGEAEGVWKGKADQIKAALGKGTTDDKAYVLFKKSFAAEGGSDVDILDMGVDDLIAKINKFKEANPELYPGGAPVVTGEQLFDKDKLTAWAMRQYDEIATKDDITKSLAPVFAKKTQAEQMKALVVFADDYGSNLDTMIKAGWFKPEEVLAPVPGAAPVAAVGKPLFDADKLLDWAAPEFSFTSQKDLETGIKAALRGKTQEEQLAGLYKHLPGSFGDKVDEGLFVVEDMLKADMAPVAAPAAPKAAPGIKWPTEGELVKVRDLDGSTHPWLAKDTDGRLWVVKDTSGSKIKPVHLRSEAQADTLYRALGVPVPQSRIIESPGGPMKVAEYLEGQTLAQWKVGKSAREINAMYKQLQENFVADALFANHDVAGMAKDNIFIVAGKAYRIDNGGALMYRAQGGAKRTWTSTVTELESMRDASTNPQTAEIFKGITDDEINRQIRGIVARRGELLAAVEDDGVRAKLAARIDDLAARLPAEATRPAPAGANRALYGNGPEVEARAAVAKANGVNLAADREDIEDMNVLVWQEIGADGKMYTRVQLKVTEEGSEKIKAALGSEFQSAAAVAPPTSNVHPDDVYWGTIQKAAKTIGHHAGDGQYNADTIAAMNEAEVNIVKALKGATGEKKEMLQHYADSIHDLNKAMTQKTAPKDVVSQYVLKPKKEEAIARPVRRDFKVRKDGNINFQVANFENGVGKATNATNNFHVRDAYTIDAGSGIEIKFIPRTGGFDRDAGLAMRGTVSITIPEGLSETAVNRALGLLDSLGVGTKPPSPAYEEALYLHRSIYLLNKHTGDTYKAIWNDTKLTDEERVVKLKTWVKTNMKIDVDKVPSYDPAGVVRGHNGSGLRVWERWDLPADKIIDEMGDYAIKHTTGGLYDSPRGRVAKTLDGVLDSGGEFTSTAGRVRKGVSVELTGGDTPEADMDTGGASYLFTRITKETDDANGFYFKLGRLSRQDAVSYDGDSFGRISKIPQRGKTIADYKQYARTRSNETNFKDGLMLNDIDYIRVRDTVERNEVLAVFKKHGISTLPDGRSVEDVVITSGEKCKARMLK